MSSDVELGRFRSRLAAWYRQNRRDLPWRAGCAGFPRGADPAYAVWVSELMLQQTRVETVLDYFPRFMRRFPNVTALADAPLDDVLLQWQGLGYYARARNLHAAASVIVNEHAGRLPADLDALRRLPGVGRYTAGAVGSIGFGLRAAVVDGNVARVLARAFGVRDDMSAPATRKRLWVLAEALLPSRGDCGDHNQAMMELGAMVCTPARPECPRCPVRQCCFARQNDMVDQLPVRSPVAEPKRVRLAAGGVWHRGKILILRRPPKGIWGGLWELPTAELPTGADPAKTLRQYLDEMLGVAVADLVPLGTLTHQLTHRRMEFHAYAARLDGRRRPRIPPNGVWVAPEELDGFALPVAHQKLLQRLLLTWRRNSESRPVQASGSSSPTNSTSM